MLYELIGVVRPGKVAEVKEIAKTAGSLILARNGVVRGITNWGTFLLPRPIRKYQLTHHTGHYFVMRFDSSAPAQHEVQKTLKLDPRLIRYSVVKLGAKLDDIKDVEGKVRWNSEESAAEERARIGD